jgi:Mrp family chromosome partitioning ATPase
MGRMLESLKKGNGSLLRTETPTAADPCVTEWAVNEEQAPYIEIGGPNKLVEGSADVLAAHPAQARQRPHPAVEQALAKSALMTQLTDAQPIAVAYEPWTGVRTSARIAPEVIVYHQPAHAVSRQYGELIQKMVPGNGPLCLLVAGVKPQVGTTTVLVNLGVAAALGGRRVLVVDAHLQRPGVAPRLGFEPDFGLEHVLLGKAAVEEAIVQTIVPSLHVLPVKERTVETVLGHDAAAWLLGLLRTRFELLLCDGPTFDSAALLHLAPSCDALYLVAPRGDTVPLDRGAVHALSRKGTHLRGILHTHLAG